MKPSKRRVEPNILNHCYQRTVDRVLIFYCISDYLVFFTTLCVTARQHKIRILAASLMPDHIHLSVVEERKGELSAFVREYTSRFSRMHNRTCHFQGNFFESPFGSVLKRGDKNVRSNLIYVGNNAPERRLCKNAEEYRWNFLAYAINAHPFSDELIVRRASPTLRRARLSVLAMFRKERPIPYRMLQNWFSRLSREEKEQLTDFIINTYNVIDYASAISFFKSYGNMLLAMHSTTGSEYEIKEYFNGRSDAHYAMMASYLLKHFHLNDIHDILALPIAEKSKIFVHLCNVTDALPNQIAAFLRIPLEYKR